MTPYQSALEAALEAMRKASRWIYYRRLAGGDPISEEEELLFRAAAQAKEALQRQEQEPVARRLTDEELDEFVMDEKGLPRSHLEYGRAIESTLAALWGVKLP